MFSISSINLSKPFLISKSLKNEEESCDTKEKSVYPFLTKFLTSLTKDSKVLE